LALLCVAFLSVAACSTDTSNSPPAAAVQGDGSVAAAQQGEGLTSADAGRLEETLQGNPSDLNAREQLVGYYFFAQATGLQLPGTSAGPNAPIVAHDRHVLWLIQNAATLELLSSVPLGVVQPAPDTAGYAAALSAWLHQAGPQAPPQVKGNAGIFLAQTGDPRALALLTAAEAGDTQNPSWPSALGDLYLSRARGAPLASTAQRQAAASAVAEMEKAWNLGGSSATDPLLSQIAKLAIVAGEDDKAVQYATVLLNTFKAGPNQSPLTVGGPIHDGNMVLGQVALHKRDRAGAEQYLLKAGATPGSPQLDQFGPNFSLARDLLVAGSKDVVLQYCAEVAKFWPDPKLAAWRTAIAAGRIPDFGDNLWT
jgi:hypothetical protein